MSKKICKACGEDAEMKCEICGKAGSLFVVLGKKGGNNADFYWICERCEKAINWVFARIDEAKQDDDGQ